eukprot:m.74988 g.74988  ORF g.74988 m.74988 type:complete len:105 (-) comp13960_c0_seq3:101-415(-)
MVVLSVKRGDDALFLYETSTQYLVDDITNEVADLYNTQLRIDRLCMGKPLVFSAVLIHHSSLILDVTWRPVYLFMLVCVLFIDSTFASYGTCASMAWPSQSFSS